LLPRYHCLLPVGVIARAAEEGSFSQSGRWRHPRTQSFARRCGSCNLVLRCNAPSRGLSQKAKKSHGTRLCPAARSAPEVLQYFFRPNGGRGECRVPDVPAARVQKSAHGRHHESTGIPGIPARNGFNGLFRALPGDEFLLSPSSAEQASCSPGWAYQNLRRFSTSNGCQDHTALPYATHPRQEASAACAHPPSIGEDGSSAVRPCASRSLTDQKPALRSLRIRRCRVHRIPPQRLRRWPTPLVEG
jgi:hypothetical protein